jgi:hypothetical protein
MSGRSFNFDLTNFGSLLSGARPIDSLEKQITGNPKKGFASCIRARTKYYLFIPYEIITLLPILLLSDLWRPKRPCPTQRHSHHGRRHGL